MKKTAFFLLFVLSCCTVLSGQTDVLDSGGPLMPEQAAYDITFYDMDLQIFPNRQEIAGAVTIRANIVHPINVFVLDLDKRLKVTAIENAEDHKQLGFHREESKLWIQLGYTRQAGEQMEVKVSYEGQPREAPRPPWDGGFTWTTTASGAHWIATSNQTNGADLWWPTKDHVSDESDSMALHIRVPDPLVVATNGALKGTTPHDDKTTTYHWYISTPINNYNVALNIAPYRLIEGEMKSVSGEQFPVVFYVLPEDYEKGKELFPEIIEHLQFYEKYLGPYPFRADKYGVAQTPHLGMEHQTIIAYGANFSNNSMTGRDWGFDALHHHELGHEWWGNLVTNYDWKDMWIHEGFCTYMQAVYMEELEGMEGYHKYLNAQSRFSNRLAIAPAATTSAREIYRAPIYSKGAWVLHTLRFLIGKEAFFKSLRRMAYPHPAMEAVTDGSQCRFVTTDDFRLICEEESGMDLQWFFDLYVRQPALPSLISRVEGNSIALKWETPDNLPFKMPVEVQLGNEIKRVEVDRKGVSISFKNGIKPEVDPNRWVLMQVK